MTKQRRKGPGRPPGRSSSRDDILAAARAQFEERGYDGATVRAIAARADVDPAMIHHFFGTKEKLFLAAMEIPLNPAVLVEGLTGGAREELGERAVRTFLRLWGDATFRAPVLALLRSAMTNKVAAALLRQFVTRVLLARVAAELADLPDAELRIEAMMSHLVGMGMLRYVVQVEPIASASEEELVALIGPVIQQYISGP